MGIIELGDGRPCIPDSDQFIPQNIDEIIHERLACRVSVPRFFRIPHPLSQ